MQRFFQKTRICELPRNQDGASAVEFALVAPLFFSLIFSCFEMGWVTIRASMLDRAIDRTTRLVRLGNGSIESSEQAIRERICREAMVIIDCQKSLVLEFTPIESMTDFPKEKVPCVDRSSAIRPVTTFNVGQSQQVVYVRACAVIDPVTPGLGLGMALQKDSTGGFQLIAASAFLNE